VKRTSKEIDEKCSYGKSAAEKKRLLDLVKGGEWVILIHNV